MPNLNMTELAEQARRLRQAIPHPDLGEISELKIRELFEKLDQLAGKSFAQPTLADTPPFPPDPGEKVAGTYLDHPIMGVVTSKVKLANTDIYRIEIDFDAPIDAITFPGLSVFRNRVSCLIDGSGISIARTSKDQPYLVLHRRPLPAPKRPPLKLTIQRM